MGCISLLGGVHFDFLGVQMGCNLKAGWGASIYEWGANLGGGVHFLRRLEQIQVNAICNHSVLLVIQRIGGLQIFDKWCHTICFESLENL